MTRVSAVDYVEGAELGRGGMAVVYQAMHRVTNYPVALKRPLPYKDIGCEERLAREIAVMASLSHPNVMPVLDHGVDEAGFSWYAMPIALGNLKTLWGTGRLGTNAEPMAQRVLEEVGAGLGAMHAGEFVHRDVNPNNVLALSDPAAPGGYRWVVSDCGIVRQPPGETAAGLTGTATSLGTPGYIAPESFGAPHGVSASADIYGLGRVLGWLLTGITPVYTERVLPEGPWRGVVRAYTAEDPVRRPQSIEDALALASTMLAAMPVSTAAQFVEAVRLQGPNLPPDSPLWDIVEENLEDQDFVLDDLMQVLPDAAKELGTTRSDLAARIAEKVCGHLTNGSWGYRGFDYANTHLGWVLAVLAGLDHAGKYGYFEDVAVAYADAVRRWDRYAHNDYAGPWLRALGEPAGAAMARAIRDADAKDYFRRSIIGDARCSSGSLDGFIRS
jgi:serine/threonine protein kinase